MSEVKVCRVCGVELVAGGNCYPSRFQKYDYICIKCSKDARKTHPSQQPEQKRIDWKEYNAKTQQSKKYYYNHLEERRESSRRYYLENKPCINKRNKEYYYNHRERLSILYKNYRETHKQIIKDRNRKYYETNLGKIRIQKGIYRNTNRRSIRTHQNYKYRANRLQKIEAYIKYRQEREESRRIQNAFSFLDSCISGEVEV